jgi:hypothetical protein
MEKTGSILLVLFISLTLLSAFAAVSATPNLGMLRVSSFICPRQVAPGATFPVSLDVEYAIQGLPNNATIRGAIYPGDINSSSPLWQSKPASVSNGGDEVWNITLTAPRSQGLFNLTAYALFLENGTWTYFTNPINGPGFSQLTVKLSNTANLDVNVGEAGIGVTVNGITVQTSAAGDATFPVAGSANPLVSVPQTVEFQNSTRISFAHWSDGVTQPERHVIIDGDVNIAAHYRVQYLLTLNSGSTSVEWYDKGANATINAPSSVPVPWPLGALGVTDTFHAWSGDIQSTSPRLNVTMDSPKTITADYTVDYRPLVLPAILGLGIVVAIVSFVLVRGRSSAGEETLAEAVTEQPIPQSNATCPTCGQETEQDWRHCIKCGTKLKIADSPQDGPQDASQT